MSEMPRYSLPELRAISSGARDRLSYISRLLLVVVGLIYVAWQPVMLWLSPGAWDPLSVRFGIAGLCGLAAWVSLRPRWERHLLRIVHGLAALITAHFFAVAAFNHLPPGLTISAQLVELMGGRIRVKSALGEGSVFHVDLSFPRANLDPESLASSTVKSTGRYQSPPNRLRVLVAEDNAVNARVVRHFLEKVGSQVTVAQTGAAALEQALNHDFHLLLLDVQMPEMTGLEVCRAIRKHESVYGGHRPIVMLTAQAMKGDREECLAAGADDYVTKPVTRRTLFSAIARLMDQGAFGHGSSSHLPVATLTGEDGSSGNLLAAAPVVDTAVSLPPPSLPGGVLDRVELLARVDGDRVLLAELVRLFVQERPTLLGGMEAALAAGDAQELARSAHTAKGAFGNLSAPLAQQAAVELELLARHGELALATDVFLRLRHQVDRLEAELLAFTQDDRAA